MDYIRELLANEISGIRIITLLYAFIAILGGFVLKSLMVSFINRVAQMAEKSGAGWLMLILKSLPRPVGWACVLGGIYACTLVLPVPVEPVDVRKFLDAMIRSLSVALIIWLTFIILDSLMDMWSESAGRTETKIDDMMVPIVRSSAKTFLVLIGVVMFLQNLGYSVSSLLAGLGIGGMAVALASKDTIANLFGSIVLFVDRPFQIGDWIEMDGIEGTVEEIGLRTTKIRTFANSQIITPNHIFTTTAINNWSRMKKRRIKMTIGVTYQTDPQKLEAGVEKIRQIIREDEKIRDDFFLVNFDNFGPYSLDIFVYCFTVSTVWGEFLQARQDFMLKVMYAFKEMGIEFAYPTQSLYVNPVPGLGADVQRPQ
ncbi:MAG TPA: mechanosensitive ion channel family protein [bacterium]|nr:mechanosensitive ion channel family protein [bacterium]